MVLLRPKASDNLAITNRPTILSLAASMFFCKHTNEKTIYTVHLIPVAIRVRQSFACTTTASRQFRKIHKAIRVLKQNKSDGHDNKFFNTALTFIAISEFRQSDHGNNSEVTLTPEFFFFDCDTCHLNSKAIPCPQPYENPPK